MAELNLVSAIRTIEEEIRKLTYEFQQKVDPYEKSLKHLKELNTACLKCGGTGKILRSRACAEDDRPDPDDPRDWHQCPACRGSGRKN